MCDRVVFPLPGGPQKIIDGTYPDSMILRKGVPGPTMDRCETYPSKSSGRIRSAKGVVMSIGVFFVVFLTEQIYTFVPRKPRPARGNPRGLEQL